MRLVSCKALRECVLPGFPDQGRTDRRTYGDVTGVIWLQISCQPVGIFAKTMLLWNWPLVAFPLYCPFTVTRLIATATSPPYTRIFMSGCISMVPSLVAPDVWLARRSALVMTAPLALMKV